MRARSPRHPSATPSRVLVFGHHQYLRNFRYPYQQVATIPSASPVRVNTGTVCARESMRKPSSIPPATSPAIVEPTPTSRQTLGGSLSGTVGLFPAGVPRAVISQQRLLVV